MTLSADRVHWPESLVKGRVQLFRLCISVWCQPTLKEFTEFSFVCRCAGHLWMVIQSGVMALTNAMVRLQMAWLWQYLTNTWVVKALIAGSLRVQQLQQLWWRQWQGDAINTKVSTVTLGWSKTDLHSDDGCQCGALTARDWYLTWWCDSNTRQWWVQINHFVNCWVGCRGSLHKGTQ